MVQSSNKLNDIDPHVWQYLNLSLIALDYKNEISWDRVLICGIQVKGGICENIT